MSYTSLTVQRFSRLADAIVEPLVDAFNGYCIDEDFSLSENPTLLTRCRSIVFRALLSDPTCCGPDESILRAKSALSAGYRVFRLGNKQFVYNTRGVGGVAYTADVVLKYWPDFPIDVVGEVEFLTSVEG